MSNSLLSRALAKLMYCFSIKLLTYCVIVLLGNVLESLFHGLGKTYVCFSSFTKLRAYCVVVLLGDVQESLVQGLGKTYVLCQPF
jgi:hypothetical protein